MNLEAIAHQVGKQEFSGIGFCEVINGDIYCYQILLLDVGSRGYSEIPSERLIKALENVPDRDNVRLWYHRHPIEGWSTTDLNTIMTAPMGGIPEIVKWSASIVRTPTRWIGRVDNHISKAHVVAQVEPNINPDLVIHARNLLVKYWNSLERDGQLEATINLSDFPDQPIFQSSFLEKFDETEIDDWLDMVYTDDKDEGWEIVEEPTIIENYVKGIRSYGQSFAA